MFICIAAKNLPLLVRVNHESNFFLNFLPWSLSLMKEGFHYLSSHVFIFHAALIICQINRTYKCVLNWTDPVYRLQLIYLKCHEMIFY